MDSQKIRAALDGRVTGVLFENAVDCDGVGKLTIVVDGKTMITVEAVPRQRGAHLDIEVKS